MREDEKKLRIDVGIITIKPEEFSAVVSRLGKWSNLNRDQHYYIFKSITDTNGLQHNVAVSRCLEPGTGNAQSLAADMIEELKPAWLFLVGIAGGIPAPEYSLGDVLLCTRFHDFSVCCIQEHAPPTFTISGGPIHPTTAKLLEILPAYENYLETCGWNTPTALQKDRPTVDINSPYFINELYGDVSWQQDVMKSLEINFSKPRKPKYYLGPFGSSDRLVKSVSLLKTWQNSARGLAAVEMELAGVYRAAHKKNIPVLAVRSLSDIVGYKRSPEWTQFACESAASFAICLIEAGLLTIDKGTEASPQETVSVSQSNEMQTSLENKNISLSNEPSTFHSSSIKEQADKMKQGRYTSFDINRQSSYEDIQKNIEPSTSIEIINSIIIGSRTFKEKKDESSSKVKSDMEEVREGLKLLEEIKEINREDKARYQQIENETKINETKIEPMKTKAQKAGERREGELIALDITGTLNELRDQCVKDEAFAVKVKVEVLKNKVKDEKSLGYLENIGKMLDALYDDPFRKIEETHQTRIIELCNYIEEAYFANLIHGEGRKK